MTERCIFCATLAEMVEVSALLVAQGVTFTARTATLTVTLTGGF